MTATATATKTLNEFLAGRAICRVWYVSVAAPAGSETALNTDDDAPGEDYCDAESLLGTDPIPAALAAELTGTVSRDGDGEYRWTVDGESLSENGVTDCAGSTVLNLTVWAD